MKTINILCKDAKKSTGFHVLGKHAKQGNERQRVLQKKRGANTEEKRKEKEWEKDERQQVFGQDPTCRPSWNKIKANRLACFWTLFGGTRPAKFVFKALPLRLLQA